MALDPLKKKTAADDGETPKRKVGPKQPVTERRDGSAEVWSTIPKEQYADLHIIMGQENRKSMSNVISHCLKRQVEAYRSLHPDWFPKVEEEEDDQ